MEINRVKIIEILQILLYKENPSLLEKINFEDDNIFLEPLLFAYFNSKKDNLFSEIMLTEITQGYFVEKESLLLKESFNNEGIAYVPNLGYFDKEGKKVDDIFIIQNSSIELLIHPIVHLKSIFRDFNENVIEENKIEISKEISLKRVNALTNALQYIKTNNKIHYDLIEQCCKKIVLFETDPKNTNSFSTINAHGIAFYNAYQKEYNEVFFLDDIAHQNSHNLLNIIINGQKDFFRIDKNVVVDSLTDNDLNVLETRSLEIVYHSLFTYYWTFTILDDFLCNYYKNDLKLIEARARICFYIYKCYMDIQIFENTEILKNDINLSLNSIAIEIYNSIKEKYKYIYNKYKAHFDKFNFKNQPYNFTMKNFLESNEI